MYIITKILQILMGVATLYFIFKFGLTKDCVYGIWMTFMYLGFLNIDKMEGNR